MSRLTTILSLYFAIFTWFPVASILAMEKNAWDPMEYSGSEDDSPRHANHVMHLIEHATQPIPILSETPRPQAPRPLTGEEAALQAAIKASLEEAQLEESRRQLQFRQEELTRIHREREEKRRAERDRARAQGIAVNHKMGPFHDELGVIQPKLEFLQFRFNTIKVIIKLKEEYFSLLAKKQLILEGDYKGQKDENLVRIEQSRKFVEEQLEDMKGDHNLFAEYVPKPLEDLKREYKILENELSDLTRQKTELAKQLQQLEDEGDKLDDTFRALRTPDGSPRDNTEDAELKAVIKLSYEEAQRAEKAKHPSEKIPRNATPLSPKFALKHPPEATHTSEKTPQSSSQLSPRSPPIYSPPLLRKRSEEKKSPEGGGLRALAGDQNGRVGNPREARVAEVREQLKYFQEREDILRSKVRKANQEQIGVSSRVPPNMNLSAENVIRVKEIVERSKKEGLEKLAAHLAELQGELNSISDQRDRMDSSFRQRLEWIANEVVALEQREMLIKTQESEALESYKSIIYEHTEKSQSKRERFVIFLNEIRSKLDAIFERKKELSREEYEVLEIREIILGAQEQEAYDRSISSNGRPLEDAQKVNEKWDRSAAIRRELDGIFNRKLRLIPLMNGHSPDDSLYARIFLESQTAPVPERNNAPPYSPMSDNPVTPPTARKISYTPPNTPPDKQ